MESMGGTHFHGEKGQSGGHRGCSAGFPLAGLLQPLTDWAVRGVGGRRKSPSSRPMGSRGASPVGHVDRDLFLFRVTDAPGGVSASPARIHLQVWFL